MNCSSCEKQLAPVFPAKDVCKECGLSERPGNPYQLEDALHIRFIGYYGAYFDDLFSGDKDAVICENCANELCETFPWIKGLIER